MSLGFVFADFFNCYGFIACRVMTFTAASHGHYVMTPDVHRRDGFDLMYEGKCFRSVINLFCRDFFF